MTNKKFQKKSVRTLLGSMITSKNVNPFTGAKQLKSLGGYMVTSNPKTSGEKALKPTRYTDKYGNVDKSKSWFDGLWKTSDTEIEVARKKRLAKKTAKKKKKK